MRSATQYTAATSAPVAQTRRGAGALILRLCVLGCIALAPLAFSVWVDPARIVASRDEEDAIATALHSGRNVTDFTNYDDRAIERALARLRTDAPVVLALGSSRLQPLDSSEFHRQELINASVQQGTLDDILGVYGLYDVEGRRPRRIIINVDPWTESYRVNPAWGAVASERAAVMQRMGVPVSPIRDRLMLTKIALKRVAAPDYFWLSARSFRRHGARGIPWVATDSVRNRAKTKLPNGTVVWPQDFRDVAEPLAQQYAQQELRSDERFKRLDAREPGRERTLERFLDYVRRQGVDVTVVLVPYPIEVYQAFATLPGHSVAAVEAELRAMVQRTGTALVGSYDPRPLGITTPQFYDESHLRAETLGRLLMPQRAIIVR